MLTPESVKSCIVAFATQMKIDVPREFRSFSFRINDLSSRIISSRLSAKNGVNHVLTAISLRQFGLSPHAESIFGSYLNFTVADTANV